MPTIKAHRVQKAERIVRQAYGIDRRSIKLRVIRYELLGSDVALAVVCDLAKGRTIVKVARRLADGRAMQMRKACRNNGFASIKDQLNYFETMYAQYGNPE
jgi:hypothetical protein